MKLQAHFLPINSQSLPHYFGKGIILPSRYLINKPADIQNGMPGGLLFCRKEWVKNIDCCIEVILSDKEENSLVQVSDNFYYFQGAIPISRVRSVSFLSENQRKTTVWNINNGAAFIPEHLTKVFRQNSSETISAEELNNLAQPNDLNDLSKFAKYYDHLLGGFSLMKAAADASMDYPSSYFPTIGYFNERIKEDCSTAVSQNKIKSAKNFSGIFSKSDLQWGKWQSYLYKNIDIYEVENIAAKENIKIEKKLGVPQLNTLNSNSIIYDLLILATYGESKKKSIDTFVSDIQNGIIPSHKKEELALLIGLNNGYSTIRNSYNLSDLNQPIKFEFSSRLDYYIVESLFQFAFNSQTNNRSFPYIDEWVPETSGLRPSKESFIIVDKWVTLPKKKQGLSLEYFEEFVQNYPPNQIYQAITSSIFDWMPPFVARNEEFSVIYFANILKEPIARWLKEASDHFITAHQTSLESQKDDLYNEFQNEKEQMNAKLRLLNDECSHLKNELELFKSKNSSSLSSNSTPQNVVQEEKTEYNKPEELRDSLDYAKLDIKSLKKIAKEKGIKPLPTKAEDIIKAIKSIKTLL